MKPPPVRIYRLGVPPGPGAGRRAMGGRKGDRPHKFSAGVGREPPKIGETPHFDSAIAEMRARARHIGIGRPVVRGGFLSFVHGLFERTFAVNITHAPHTHTFPPHGTHLPNRH